MEATTVHKANASSEPAHSAAGTDRETRRYAIQGVKADAYVRLAMAMTEFERVAAQNDIAICNCELAKVGRQK